MLQLLFRNAMNVKPDSLKPLLEVNCLVMV
jgi:hypothetical protein